MLVLLPTSTNKLLAEWCGPYPILRRVNDVNYEINMTDRRKKKRIFHVNMLREWHTPSVVSLFAEKSFGETDDDVILWDRPTDGDTCEPPIINAQLDQAQRNELDGLLQRYSDVLSSHPGKTECRINTGTSRDFQDPSS